MRITPSSNLINRERIPSKRRASGRLLGFLAMAALAIHQRVAAAETSSLSPDTLEKILSHHNRGVAWMEQFEPIKAGLEFRQVVKLAPKWIPGRVNLAIALLNSQ